MSRGGTQVIVEARVTALYKKRGDERRVVELQTSMSNKGGDEQVQGEQSSNYLLGG